MDNKKLQKNELREAIAEWTERVPARMVGIVGMLASLAAFIAGVVQLIIKARHIEPPLPWWDIPLIIGGAVIFIILSFEAFRSVRSERDKLKGKEGTENIKEIEWRREYRLPQVPEVTQIPPTLQKMWGLVANILEKKRKGECTNEKLLSVLVDMLGIDRNDPILDVRNYTSEQKIRKSWKRIGTRFGVKNRKERPKFLARWRRLLPEVPDKYGIGLMLKQSSEYTALEAQLKDMGTPISKTVIYQNIDRFLEDLAALYNLRLLLFYSKAAEHINMFPRELRDSLGYLEVNIEKQMRSELVRVKASLEDYSIGKEPKGE